MLDTSGVAWTRENTRFQLGTTMLDTHLGGLDTWKHVVPVRGHHVRYPPGWPAHVKTRGSSPPGEDI